MGFHARPHFRGTLISPAEGFTFETCLSPCKGKCAELESRWLPCTLPLLIPSNANLHLNNGGRQLHKNTVFARADQTAASFQKGFSWYRSTWLDTGGWSDSFRARIGFFCLVGGLTFIKTHVTRWQTPHRCQPTQWHFHLEFNLEAFYFHHRRHQVTVKSKSTC